MEIFYTVFWLAILLPLLAILIYYIALYKQFYSIKEITNLLTSSYTGMEDLSTILRVVKIVFLRINGWCSLMILFSSLTYLLNIWSTIFCLLNLYVLQFSKVQLANFEQAIVLCSLLSAISTFVNLILNCKKRWLCFRAAWQKSSPVANKFLIDMVNSSYVNLQSLVAGLNSEISSIEDSIEED